MRSRRQFLFAAVPAAALLNAQSKPAAGLHLKLRTRVEAFKGSGVWNEVRFEETFPVAETAVIICDMWDNHWCSGAAKRVTLLAPKLNSTVEIVRNAGVRIIHAPSETMPFYKDAPQRQAMVNLEKAAPPPAIDLPTPPLPIDDTTGGCDTTADKFYKAWSRQNAAIGIAAGDLISDNGTEVFSLLKRDGIKNLLVMGVHTNMCVLNRTFAIKQMTRWGIRCVLVRDLTDAMYNPGDRPFVSHEQGTEMVIQHIEKYWAPTTLSADLIAGIRK